MSEMKATPEPRVYRAIRALLSGADTERGNSALLVINPDRNATPPHLPINAGDLREFAGTMLSALKAMDAALTEAWGEPDSECARLQLELGADTLAAWIQIRSAITQADGR